MFQNFSIVLRSRNMEGVRTVRYRFFRRIRAKILDTPFAADSLLLKKGFGLKKLLKKILC
jgi:hypothetical protein